MAEGACTVHVGGRRCSFGECVVRHVAEAGARQHRAELMVAVSFDAARGALTLEPAGAGAPGPGVPIAHKTPLCPAEEFERALRDNTIRDRPGGSKVQVGVAVVLESGDGKVMLTKRQAHLRSFPSLYVLPGGSVDQGETLIQAGLRELHEETGILVQEGQSNVKCSLLCVWESTFPLSFSLDSTDGKGLTHHHIVVYVHVHAADIISADHSKLLPQVSEVSDIAWLSPEQVSLVGFGHDPASAGHLAVTLLRVPSEAFDAKNWKKKARVSEPAATVDVRALASETVLGTRFALRVFVRTKSSVL